MSPLKTLESRDLYIIGWIAALPLELAAARALLDERHDTPLDFVQHYDDPNIYTWGCIGKHNVVIAAPCVEQLSAAVSTSYMLASFPQIRFGLLVGTGEGISRPEKGLDIRLGDVAVSLPHGNWGGVIQYDLFKAKSENQQEDIAFLNRPPSILLHALFNLRAQHELERPKILEYLREAVTRYPRLAKEVYIHQRFENDPLFETSDSEKKIQRKPRDSTDPKIHYGVIASGDTISKDVGYSENILENIQDECICFETEAAGLMNTFPCVVIRGIYDYIGPKKRKQWQQYAALTAAAYAKELLAFIHCQGLQNAPKATDILENGSEDTIHTWAVTKRLKNRDDLDRIKSWLLPPDPSINLNKALEKRLEGTVSWFLESEPFEQWKTGERQHLWLHGVPGCGKTVLNAAIIDNLNPLSGSSHITLCFFFDSTDADKQSLDNLVRSLIVQLYFRRVISRNELEKLFLSCDHGCRQPSFESLSTTFMQMIKCVERIRIVIDALDECKIKRELLLWIENLAHSGHLGLQLLLTSREEEDLTSELEKWLHRGNIMSIQKESVNRDICRYVRWRLRSDRDFERWCSLPSVTDEIRIKLKKRAHGRFRWVARKLDILADCWNYDMVRKSLYSKRRRHKRRQA